jgi:hypothetical protein
MNKNIEAIARGYVYFDVNGKRFYKYNDALAERKSIQGDVEFNGFHVFKGWRCFYFRQGPRSPISWTVNPFAKVPNASATIDMTNVKASAET